MQTSFGKYVEKMVAEGEARGKAEGEARGEARGRIETLISLVNDGDISIEKAAEKAGLSVSEFAEQTKKYLSQDK